MSVLRHPVVLTSLEEDFRRIGLIKDDRLEEGLPASQGGEVGSGQQGHDETRLGEVGPSQHQRFGFEVCQGRLTA